MADEDVFALLNKASTDEVFRRALASDFDGTVSDHKLNLTNEEHEALRAVNWEQPLPRATAGKWIHIYNEQVQQ